MNSWWVHDLYDNLGLVAVASWIVVVIGSITLHELAHGWAALWEGDGTPRELGHMTGNPLVHMGSMSLLLFAVLGIAFGLMPVTPSRFRHGYVGRIVVSAAGPVMNLLLFLIFAVALGLMERFGASGPVADNVSIFLNFGAMLNVVLVVLNLLPLPPLDGWGILEGTLRVIVSRPHRHRTKMATTTIRASLLDANVVQKAATNLLNISQHPQAPIATLFVLMVLFMSGLNWFFYLAEAAVRAVTGLVAG